MSLKAISVTFPTVSAVRPVFVGGSVVLNALGAASSTGSIPSAWKGVLSSFLGADGGTFKLGGYTLQRNGLFINEASLEFDNPHHENKGPSYKQLGASLDSLDMTDAEIAAKMREILASPSTPAGSPWLAVLTGAMFLSEVVRNPRSFAVNLMLLDFLETGQKYGSGNNKDFSFEKLLGYKSGKSKTYTYTSGAVTVDSSNAANRAGKLPMSHLGAMEQYQGTIEKPFNNDFSSFSALQAQASLKLSGPSAANTAQHFPNALLEKEATICIRWLCAYLNKKKVKYPKPAESKFTGWGSVDVTKGPTPPQMIDATFGAKRDQTYTANEDNCTGTSTNQTSSDYWAFNVVKQTLGTRYSNVSCLI